MEAQDLKNIEANIEEAKKVGMERVVISVTLAEAEEIIWLYRNYHVEHSGKTDLR